MNHRPILQSIGRSPSRLLARKARQHTYLAYLAYLASIAFAGLAQTPNVAADVAASVPADVAPKESADATADSTEDARSWLERMSRAVHELNYDGTFVFQSGASMEAMRIIHRFGSDGERERLVSLSGAAREVVRSRDSVVCILPDDQSVVVSKRRLRSTKRDPWQSADPGIAQFYRLQTRSGDRVAGRDTQQVVVQPRDVHRYGYRLSIDRASGLLLKSELLDDHGGIVEQIVYTRIELPEHIPDELFEPAVSGDGFRWISTDGGRLVHVGEETGPWHVSWAPRGFKLSGRETGARESGESGEPDRLLPSEHLVLTDGLATISIFIESLDSAEVPLEGASSMGAVNAFGAVLGSYQVTVVGEVPARTVELIGRAVVRR